MRTFLRVDDATPHASTAKSPYLMMFDGQELRGKILTLVEPADDDDVMMMMTMLRMMTMMMMMDDDDDEDDDDRRCW